MGVSTYTYLKWQRRAETIQRNAELLTADMIDELGMEHPLSDGPDLLAEAAERLALRLAAYGDSAMKRPTTKGKDDEQ